MDATKTNTVRRAAIGLLVVFVAACAAPDLDKSMVGESVSTVRARIVDHGGWSERLSAEELDQVAGFIADAVSGRPTTTAPGLTVWRTNECGSCHALAAGRIGD